MLTIPTLKAKLGSRYRKPIIEADPTLTANQIKHALSGECDDLSRIEQVQAAAQKAIDEMAGKMEKKKAINEALKTNR